jgi:hypothetical protein
MNSEVYGNHDGVPRVAAMSHVVGVLDEAVDVRVQKGCSLFHCSSIGFTSTFPVWYGSEHGMHVLLRAKPDAEDIAEAARRRKVPKAVVFFPPFPPPLPLCPPLPPPFLRLNVGNALPFPWQFLCHRLPQPGHLERASHFLASQPGGTVSEELRLLSAIQTRLGRD